jgi:two-component sensor histidine kinase
MNIYTHKKSWKFILFLFAVVIVVTTFWAVNSFVQKLAREEKAQIEIWAKAISRKAQLVKYTEELFSQLRSQEKKYVQQWASATKKLINADEDTDISFYTEFINGNENIPVIVTDDNGKITATRNVDERLSSEEFFTERLKSEFTEYEPIRVNYYQNRSNYIYYRNSKLFDRLQMTMDDLVKSFLNEVVDNSLSNTVIITDSSHSEIIAYSGDIDTTAFSDSAKIKHFINSFSNKPIVVSFANYGNSYIYYNDSYLLQQASYFPVFLFLAMAIFLLVSYFLFSLSRKAEQNLVWVGLAKETAHQLGTPLSSLLGWIELLKLKSGETEALTEMENDISRLKLVSERFSKIGSKPELVDHNISEIINSVLDYFKKRINKNIIIKIYDETNQNQEVKINRYLFEWVLENVLKNSVDAMQNKKGLLNIYLSQDNSSFIVDIEDNGRGIHKSNFKSVFKPGYTTKDRGWGLGLSLAKRIIENYHNGKIFVKSSIPHQSTIIRIVLKTK